MKNSHLQLISEMLLLNGTLLESPGLWYGRTGVAVFFFHYAQYTGNELFEDYAAEIINNIQDAIHKDSPIDYDRGLTGIGAGIEYLAQNGYLDIGSDNVLEDFDNRLLHDVRYRPEINISLHSGLTGLGHYFLSRITGTPQTTDNKQLLTYKKMIARTSGQMLHLPDGQTNSMYMSYIHWLMWGWCLPFTSSAAMWLLR
jgi:hypothetical protein